MKMKACLIILQLVLASLVSAETVKNQKRGPRQYFEQPQGYDQQPYAVQPSLPALSAPVQYPQGPSQHQAPEPLFTQHTPQISLQGVPQYPSTAAQYPQQGTSQYQVPEPLTTQYVPPVAPVQQAAPVAAALPEPTQYSQQGAQYQAAEPQPAQYNAAAAPVQEVAPITVALPQSTQYSQQGAQYQAAEPQPSQYNPPITPVQASHAAEPTAQYQAPKPQIVQYSPPVAPAQEVLPAPPQYPQQGVAEYQVPAAQPVQYSTAVGPAQEVPQYSNQPATISYQSASSKGTLNHQSSYSAPVSNDISQYADQPVQAKLPSVPSTPIQPGRAYGPAPPVTVPPVKTPQYHEQPSSYAAAKPSPTYQVAQPNVPHETPKPTAVPAKSDSQWEAGTIPYVLEKLGFNSFNDLFVLAGIESVIEKEGPITVLVPPDAAFDALTQRFGGTEAALEQFNKQPEALVSLLKAHIIPGIYPAESLIDNSVSRSLLGTPLRVKHFEAEDHEWRPLRVITVNGARVIRTSIPAKNGLIHIIDRPMFPVPSADIYNSLKNDPEQRFKTLVSAIETAGLVYQLANPLNGPFTLFAPTDKAFSYVSSADLTQLFSNPYKLAKLLQRHLVKDLIYTSGMQGFQKAYALDYELLYIYHMKGMTKVNGANVIDSDVTTLNGVIHSIDSVLGL